jgi:hypothetical protein
MKTIDLTPTWSQWLNTVMAISLRGKDPAKVLEPLSEDFKRLARAGDAWNALPKELPELLQEAINALSISHPDLADRLEVLKAGTNKSFELIIQE